MKTTGVLLGLICMFTFCSTPKNDAQNVNTAKKRFMLPKGNNSTINAGQDTLMITGTEKLPLLGRSETGVADDLEGTWVLKTLEGKDIVENSSIHTPPPPKAIESKSDTITTLKKENGRTDTLTETITQRPAQITQITPPQGNNYHIPEKPRLSFYGSNETFSGFTGCNKIAGRYKMVKPNYISFQQAAPSTKMACIGDYDETKFVNALYKVKSFNATSGTLQLMNGTTVLMVFERE